MRKLQRKWKWIRIQILDYLCPVNKKRHVNYVIATRFHVWFGLLQSSFFNFFRLTRFDRMVCVGYFKMIFMLQQMRIGLLLDLNLILVIVFLIFFLNVRKENNFQRLGEDRKTKRERETLKVRKGQRGRRIRRRRKGSKKKKT